MYDETRYIHYPYDEVDGRKGLGYGAWIIAIVFLIFMFTSIGGCMKTYNKLVDIEENVNFEFSSVQATMQSRLEKILDLLKFADKTSEHIEDLIGNISNARTELSNCNTPEELDAVNAEISNNLNRLLAIIEECTTITSSKQYTSLMDEIKETSDRILVAREDYNEAASQYNRVLEKFPGTILAKLFDFEAKDEFVSDFYK